MHDSLAVAVANEVLSDPDTTDVRLYCRSLSTMEFTPTNQVKHPINYSTTNLPLVLVVLLSLGL